VSSTQLAEQHGHKLAPARKTTRVPFRFMLANGGFELHAGKQLQQLTENAAYSVHGGSLASMIWFLAETQFTLAELSPLSHSECFNA
jgi:hypothetical protein